MSPKPREGRRTSPPGRWPPGGSAVCAVVLLGGCATAPPVADWQLDARDSLQRASSAYLEGDGRVAAAEFARARSAVAATGRADLVAMVELTRCAAQTAALDVGTCAGFEPLRADAGPDARAYADYLAARVAPADIPRLPAAQRAVAAAVASMPSLAAVPAPSGGPASAAPPAAVPVVDVGTIAEPLSRLVAAGVLLRAGLADDAVAASATAIASARGWRRPLLAWLELQARRADAAGAADEAARLRRRIELVLPTGIGGAITVDERPRH